MVLSAEGRETTGYYKALQSTELGMGFALTLAKQFLSQSYPEHFVSLIPADIVLRAGWALSSKDSGPRVGYPYRPHFFAEVWKPGEPSRAFPIAYKGSHSHGGRSTAHVQLASASAHVEAVHIGAWNETPGLVFSTELPTDGHGSLTVHALHAPGRGGKLSTATDAPERSPDQRIEEQNIFPGIQRPNKGDHTEHAEPESGYHVQPENYAWFAQVLARTDAAALAAFTGDGMATGQYLTTRQGQRHFTGPAHAVTDSIQDAHESLLGIPFVGTDHVFRLNRTRVEAFSGIATDLFQHLQKGRVEQYRSKIHSLRSAWPSTAWDPKWKGPVSVNDDGSVLAMRILRS
ncbi:hypothetical protein [Embleya sp. NPDC059237]|uniref:hypothetical protein n=1 Tax=Embleya sp. NPDC059237 TaxID=3346784 RepID=UPI00367AD7F1